uniref:Amine oxidase domain-containing protein n=1 Tax=Megaselia scalaris TaxID=36166 RepID=T1GPD8_MEGSC
MNYKQSVKIVIIGAGASGIAAATKLLKYGFQNVKILEAQSRIGGRIHTIPFGDNTLDLGAQWCHGEKGNVVFDLVKDMNILDSTGRVFLDYECIRSNGEIISNEITVKLKDIMNSIEDKEELLKQYELSLEIALEFLEVYQKFSATYEGAQTIYDVSGKGYCEYTTCPGDSVLNWKHSGYITLLNILMESKGKDFGKLSDRIKLNWPVSKIEWNNNFIKILNSNGEYLEADHIIFTGSLGVLKDNIDFLFEPRLPEINCKAIQGLGFGTYNKVFIQFSKKWWNDDFLGFALHWRIKDLESLRKTEFSWLENVVGFYIVRYQPNTLFSRVAGSSALFVETLSKAKQIEGMMYLLRTFLKNPDIPEPVDFIISSWNSNPYIKGSYSHRSMETEKMGTKASDLAQPVVGSDGKLKILFAGEATHDHFYSTVHGAVESGWREADRLNEYYTNESN